MRKILIPLLAALAAAAIANTVGAAQPPPAQPAAAPVAGALSEEDQHADPFPAGQHAALVKQVCTECHRASLILDMRFEREDAERYYKNMVSSDVETDQAKKIIAYLTTTLGVNR